MIAVSILTGLFVLSHAVLGNYTDHLGPSKDAAGVHGPQIFNAVHNAMRQWGSSVHHNGMSLFLATVPQGVLLYHGNMLPESPSGPEWLAYEIEHAERFIRSFRGPPTHEKPSPECDSGELPNQQKSMGGKSQSADGERGWLHVYQTTRPLRFLYVDGMSGGKTNMGTLDTQDYLLRGVRSSNQGDRDSGQSCNGPMGERERAISLCELCKEWDLQGIIRMEAGFEIIKCDFTDGMEQIQALQRPVSADRGDGNSELQRFEYLRGVSQRYFDIGSSRTIVDYSSMVSAFFFQLTLTNPDPNRPDLPRLSETTDAELGAIKRYLKTTIEQHQIDSTRRIDWQDVSDLFVSRYADRLQYMAKFDTSVDLLASETSFLLDLYVDYSSEDAAISSDSIHRCSNFFLHSISPVSESDHLIHLAFSEVMSQVCNTLFEIRELVTTHRDKDFAPDLAAEKLHELIEYLGWARFKHCSGCGIDEVCVIPMWPFGDEDDYYHPRCRSSSDLQSGKNYWGELGFSGREDHNAVGASGSAAT
ncbi:hypothetical protein ED733_004790 [Metarhizium rileyi]|uniref:Uncharacterized protein n=1 Tax=Metarhizium rileyi (strain RCEF 4871) TaxID=1649241 RepID=A0A5C6G7C4_METRR|nr:hypothetical protein ED733_004790 [Metarhizium rileyi]